ncbi:type II toxin-antitoxin system Phd/YefM family antitoxin [Litorihabitans aurantiacus]|nr:type II toxin-antitoxin system prevent-host-death family antitoxin [Litorihabitans aurantiacus]
MATISHRELRNNSSDVLRRVREGEAFEATDHGVAVARLAPLGAPELPFPVTRPARRRGGWTALPTVDLPRSVSDVVDDERDDRW